MEHIALPTSSPNFKLWFFALLWITPPAAFQGVSAAEPGMVDYNRDIRPILADNCYKCHGDRERKIKGGRRLRGPIILREWSENSGQTADESAFGRLSCPRVGGQRRR